MRGRRGIGCHRARASLLGAVAAVAAVAVCSAILSAQSRVEATFAAFWGAATPAEAEAAAEAVRATGLRFDDAVARLKKGRPYSADVPRGIVRASHRTSHGEFPYAIEVPASYDPARRYQVRVHLHGGVTRPEPNRRGAGGIGTLAGADQIYVIPAAWDAAPWWSDAQIESLRVILDRVRRTYNVDENRIVLSGVSDGGTAAYYVAMRDTTPYASFLPLNGFILVLANRSLNLTSELHPQNLTNKPFFIVNGGQDPLYPADRVEPYVRHLEKSGVRLVYAPQADAGHNTAWWPQVKDAFEAFVRERPREPHPASVTWEAGGSPGQRRAHWVVIDELRMGGPQGALPDVNVMAQATEQNFGVRASGMRVEAVVAGSSAARIGLQAGDVVTAVNGRTLPAALDLQEYMTLFETGAPVTFAVARNGEPVALAGSYEPAAVPRITTLFRRSQPSGRVDATRRGNRIEAATRGVGAFTLLLSPDVVDFDRPVTIVADGETVFAGRVTPRVDVLMRWAARDNDRTMLYGAEIHVKPPSGR